MEMDEDGSGEVDFDEFEAWFLSRDERYAQRLSTIVGNSQSCMVSNVGGASLYSGNGENAVVLGIVRWRSTERRRGACL